MRIADKYTGLHYTTMLSERQHSFTYSDSNPNKLLTEIYGHNVNASFII